MILDREEQIGLVEARYGAVANAADDGHQRVVVEQAAQVSGYLEKLVYDVGTLLGRRLAQYHALDPLRDAIEQLNGALQHGRVLQAAMHCIQLVVRELFLFCVCFVI